LKLIVTGLVVVGFSNISYINITEKARKSALTLYLASFLAKLVNIFRKASKYNIGNVEAAKYQYIGMKKELWEYGLFRAEKE
jgi:hypothetical membrane protein